MKKAVWQDESEVFGEEAPLHKRTNAPWEAYSLTSTELNEKEMNRLKAAAYSFKKPWDPSDPSGEALTAFERALELQDYAIKAPWTNGSTELKNEVDKKLAAKQYTYKSMWEKPELTEAQKEQLANYKIEVPFCRDDNALEESKKDARRKAPGKKPPTLPPWAHGSRPAAPRPPSNFPQPQTLLWDKPAEEHRPQLESSGDPVLDSLSK